ncbi:hypothetical protein ACOSQ3_003322 [Xanthoceras sorbifolium]
MEFEFIALIKVPEPKHFNGNRNAKELENFLWDIEQYFRAARIPEREQYMKEFSSLMLDIQNMSEEDKLFNFMSGLHTWAQAELRRQVVKDISSAMAATEGLVHFHIGSSSPSFVKKKKKTADGKKTKESESTMRKDQNKNKSKTQGCFICNGPHRARDCPKKEKINALISQDVGDSDDAGPSRVNPLQLLNTILAEKQLRRVYSISTFNDFNDLSGF